MRERKSSVTTSIIIANLVFYVLVLILTYNNSKVIDYVALTPSKILSGMYIWTLVTNMFMHGPLAHLFMNMLSLLFLGSFLERIIGPKRFLTFYFTAGIVAGLFFVFSALLFTKDLDAAAIGASGAIFGIAGVLAVLIPRLPVYILFIPVAMPMWVAVILLLLVLWALSIFAQVPIGNTAHLGGLLVGVVYGYYLRTRYNRKVHLLNKFLGVR